MKRLLLAVLLAAPVPALAADIFVEGHGGVLLGFGAEAGMDFGMVRARAQFNKYDYSTTENLDNSEYDVTLGLKSTGVLVDVFPFKGAFHITAGLYDNGNTVTADSTGPVDVDGYKASQASVKADFAGTAEYLGIGWVFGRDNKGLTGNLELGAMANGGVDVTLTAPGATQNQIDQEEKNIENDLNGYDYMPVIKLGIGYYF